jgi:hypothetical protein
MPNRPARPARRFFTTLASAFAACAFAVAGGCGGGGGGGSPAPAFVTPPSPTPSPTAPPNGPLTLSQSSVAFTLAGAATTVAVSEAGYTGAVFPDASVCGNVASVTPSSANAPATFTITALGAGACALAFSDRFGQHAVVAVGVTITQGSIR